jgi:hypothetical protein
MQTEVVTENVPQAAWLNRPASGPALFGADREAAQAMSNIRAVGFIAKPENVSDLAKCLGGPIMKLLRQAPGFAGAIILSSHAERRKVTVLSFWDTQAQATRTRWEDFTSVCNLIYPLVDACTRVQTFQGMLPGACGKSAD